MERDWIAEARVLREKAERARLNGPDHLAVLLTRRAEWYEKIGAGSKRSPEPCRECPFRRKSVRGWIGGHENPTEITSLVMGDQWYPCHLSVNGLVDGGFEFEEAVHEARPCAGASAMMNNCAKLSRNDRMAAMQKAVGRREDVFSNRTEMEQYHGEIPPPKAK